MTPERVEHRRKIRATLAAGETAEEKVARILAHGHVEHQPSLPTTQTELLTVTLDELHDLVHAAASEINHSSTALSATQAIELARRAAVQAMLRARGHDGYHRGSDPRG